MNNINDFKKICRVCMAQGSHDIFLKSLAASPTSGINYCHQGVPNLSTPPTLDRLLEKLRYVTMMKIEENDDLPRLLCDECTLHLNVAYKFKRQGVENDTRLRQYYIENGISSLSSNSSNISTTNLLNVPTNINTAATSTPVADHRNNINRNIATIVPTGQKTTRPSYPLVPFIIKTEPNDEYNDLTNENESNGTTPITTPHSTQNTNPNVLDKTKTPQSSSSVVYINGFSYNSLTPSSEVESVNGNINHSTVVNHSKSPITSRQQQKQQQNKQNNVELGNNKGQQSTVIRKRAQKRREINNLQINMSMPQNNATNPKRTRSIQNRSNSEIIGLERKTRKNSNVDVSKLNHKPIKVIKHNGNNNKTINDKNRLVVNPFCSSTAVSSVFATSEQNNVAKVKQTRKRKLYDEGRIKDKVVTKLLRPKLEPLDD